MCVCTRPEHVALTEAAGAWGNTRRRAATSTADSSAAATPPTDQELLDEYDNFFAHVDCFGFQQVNPAEGTGLFAGANTGSRSGVSFYS